MTFPRKTDAGKHVLRDLVLRMYLDHEDDPSVEVPIDDLFCNGFATRTRIRSEPIGVAPNAGFNCYFSMPFREHADITIESQHPGEVSA